ncbi:MAG: hypothetical protein MJ070_04870 [Lachnospiraceae bacterium]|nr:hypothetical protein [Lachnospiraceae bacterium]
MIILLSETIVDVNVKVIIALAVIACIVCFQVFLSKRRAKWPGLVLPAISFPCATLFILANFMVPEDGVSFGLVLEMIAAVLLANIPTAILLIIYAICRKKMRRSDQLKKMEIQDLH